MISEVDITLRYVFVNKAYENGLGIPFGIIADGVCGKSLGMRPRNSYGQRFFIVLEELAFTVQKVVVKRMARRPKRRGSWPLILRFSL